MKIDEIRELTVDELMDALIEAKEERFNLRFQVATNQLDNTARLKTVKQDIARILTVLREREIAEDVSLAQVGEAPPDGADGVSAETATVRKRRSKESA